MEMMGDDRFLLCRPAGGLYDMLCQIAMACAYADRFGRIVVVDTNYATTPYFREPFSRYFESLDPRLLLDTDRVGATLDGLATFPPEVAGSLWSYAVETRKTRLNLGAEFGMLCDARSGVPLTFDFRRDYPQPLLLHHSWGRNEYIMAALSRLRLRPAMRDEVMARLRHIGGPFDAIHIRATDYQTEYRELLSQVRPNLGARPVFLATDNAEVVRHLRAEWPDIRVRSFSRLPDNGGKPLHDLGADDTDIAQRNRDAIADALVLAHASHIHAFYLKPNSYGTTVSGFTLLAKRLAKEKTVLNRMMGLPAVPSVDGGEPSRRGRADAAAPGV